VAAVEAAVSMEVAAEGTAVNRFDRKGSRNGGRSGQGTPCRQHAERGLGLLGRSGMVGFFSHGDNRALRRRGRLPVEKCNSPDQRIAARCILLTKLVAKMEIRAYCSLVNMLRPRSAGQILLALALCSSCASDACGWSGASFLHPSIRQEETTMSFVAWVVLGLAAGFIGSQLVNRSGKSIMPDVLLGVVGAVTGGWSFYAFGPPGVNGFHLQSHFAAVFGSLVFLLTYYGLRRV